MTLLKNFPASYKYSMTFLELMSMMELMMEYVTTCLMYDPLKRKKKKFQGEDAAMVSRQNNADDLPSWQGVRMCFYCSKLGYVT